MRFSPAPVGCLALLGLSLGFSPATDAATFTIRSTDSAGEGFNDPAPFAPIGGNNATTLGQARMNVLQEATRIWGSLLQSNVPIIIDVAFDAQTCSASSGTLGSAGPRQIRLPLLSQNSVVLVAR